MRKDDFKSDSFQISDKAVTGAKNRQNHFGVGWIPLDFLSQIVDVHIDGSLGAFKRAQSGGIHQLQARAGPVAMLNKVIQQIVLDRRQRFLPAVYR